MNTITMTQTQAIRAYDRAHLSGSNLETIAYYVASASDSERSRYLAANPITAAALLALLTA